MTVMHSAIMRTSHARLKPLGSIRNGKARMTETMSRMMLYPSDTGMVAPG